MQNPLISSRTLSILLLSVLLTIPSFGSGEETIDQEIPQPVRFYHEAFLEVNVTNQDSSPVMNVYVTMVNHRSMFYSMSAMTDVNGKVIFNVAQDNWGMNKLLVKNYPYDTYIIEEIIIEPDGTYYVELQIGSPIPEGNTVRGKVTNGSTGVSLEGIKVDFLGRYPNDAIINRNMTTLESGEYCISFPDNLEYFSVTVKNERFMQFSKRHYSLKGKNDYHVNISLENMRKFHNNVKITYFDENTGDTLIGNDLRISAWSDSREQQFLYEFEEPNKFKPDQQGNYNLSDIDPGTYILRWYQRLSYFRYYNYYPVFFNGSSNEYMIPINIETDYIDATIHVRNKTSFLKDIRVGVIYPGSGECLDSYTDSKTTDSSGKVSLKVLPNRMINISLISYSSNIYKYINIMSSTDPVDITLYLETDTEVKEPGIVEINANDKKTGIGLKTGIAFYRDNVRISSLFTDDQGKCKKEIEAGHYDFISMSSSLSSMIVENIEIKQGQLIYLNVSMERRTILNGSYHIRLVDEKGEPARSSKFHAGIYGTYTTYYTDDEGFLNFPAKRGQVEIYQQDRDRYDYGLIRQTLYLNGTGGVMKDINVYSASPLYEVSGFFRDSVTKNAIPGTSVSTQSYHVTSGHDGEVAPSKDTDPLLFKQDIVTNISGYYRSWGRKDMFIHAKKEGYYPKYERLDVCSSMRNSRDIYLDPMPVRNIQVNGTIIGENDLPISASIKATEVNHPNAEIFRYETGSNGKFQLYLFKGTFTLHFGNGTVHDTYRLIVYGPIDNLTLYLQINSNLNISLYNWTGVPVPNLEILLEKDGYQGYSIVRSSYSDPEGKITFMVSQGTYRICISLTDLYGPYWSEPFDMLYKTDKEMYITLYNRTFGDLHVKIQGNDGPFKLGIPNAIVKFYEVKSDFFGSYLADDNGSFSLRNFSFGIYRLEIEPPDQLMFIKDSMSGYVPVNYDLEFFDITYDIKIGLDYKVHDFLNVTYVSPKGNDVLLDEPIIIQFSHLIDRSTITGNIRITPSVGEPTIQFPDNRTVRLDHERFIQNTVYTVNIGPGIRSEEGYRLLNELGYQWNFTTFLQRPKWAIHSALVKVEDDRSIVVSVEGEPNMDIFLIIGKTGSYKFTVGGRGYYSLIIDGSAFEWDTEYSYHFSDRDGGPDMDPLYSGTFRTPKEPDNSKPQPAGWHLDTVTVEVDANKNWHVKARGSPGLDVHIVIEGIGSFIMEEWIPGNYSISIDGAFFKWGITYHYHFSDTERGSTLEGYGHLSGNKTMPEEILEKEDNGRPIGSILVAFVLLSIIVSIFVTVYLATRRKVSGLEE